MHGKRQFYGLKLAFRRGQKSIRCRVGNRVQPDSPYQVIRQEARTGSLDYTRSRRSASKGFLAELLANLLRAECADAV